MQTPRSSLAPISCLLASEAPEAPRGDITYPPQPSQGIGEVWIGTKVIARAKSMLPSIPEPTQGSWPELRETMN